MIRFNQLQSENPRIFCTASPSYLNNLTQLCPTVSWHLLQSERPGLHDTKCSSWGCDDWGAENTGELVNKTHITKTNTEEVVDVLLQVSMRLAEAEDSPGHQSVSVEDGVGRQGRGEVGGGGKVDSPIKVIEHHQLDGVEIFEWKIIFHETVQFSTSGNLFFFFFHLGSQQQSTQSNQIELWILNLYHYV